MNQERYFLHFKGGLYKILGFARDSESLERLVVYQALYGDQDLWVRPEKMFFEKIIRNGVEVQRFKEITQEEMLCLYQDLKENI